MADHMLTTVDNPFNPFTHYDEWLTVDSILGYHTPELLARIAITSTDLSEADQDAAIEAAIDEIVKQNVSGMHKKIALDSDE